MTSQERNISTINYIHMKETSRQNSRSKKNPNAGDTSKQVLMEKKERISESMICSSNTCYIISI
jgi:hypothetical protein